MRINKNIAFIALLIALLLGGLQLYSYFFYEKKYYPSTIQKIDAEKLTSFKRVKDLHTITIALENFKNELGHYPISSDSGKNWDGLYSKYGESKNNWIEGLTPKFITELPRDPRNHDNPVQQYIYKSDGANYKLLTHGPDDCNRVMTDFPELIDPYRTCWAYGFWTVGARRW